MKNEILRSKSDDVGKIDRMQLHDFLIHFYHETVSADIYRRRLAVTGHRSGTVYNEWCFLGRSRRDKICSDSQHFCIAVFDEKIEKEEKKNFLYGYFYAAQLRCVTGKHDSSMKSYHHV